MFVTPSVTFSSHLMFNLRACSFKIKGKEREEGKRENCR